MRYVVQFVVEAASQDEARRRAQQILAGSECMVGAELAGATQRLRPVVGERARTQAAEAAAEGE